MDRTTTKSVDVNVEVVEEDIVIGNTSSRTRSKSSAANGSDEEVDGPWNPSHEGFILGRDGFVIVYTDGACSNNGRNNAKAGLGVWFNHKNPL